MATLHQGLQSVATDLSRFAAKDDFRSLFADVFGNNPGRAAIHGIQSQLLRGDLSRLARVEVIDGAQLGAANAAYASASNTIYLSDRFLARASLGELRAVLLEEFGHAIDARVNLSDRPGDEGELFSLLVLGLTPTASKRQRILADDDRRTLTINGAPVAVEQAAPVVYETTLIRSADRTYLEVNNSGKFAISGSHAAWVSQRGANEVLQLFNGTSTTTIANSIYKAFGRSSSGESIDLAISGGTVVYSKSDGKDLEIYRYNGGVTTKLTTNTSNDSDVLIDGNTIVWQGLDQASGSKEIYRHNGTTSTRVTNNATTEEDVQLSGNWLVWAEWDGNDYEIFLNDGISTRALTNNTVDDYSPVLKDNHIAWMQWNNNQENLFFYDGSTTSQVTTNQEIYAPMIAGNNLIYQQREESGNISLSFYNSSTKIISQLSSDLGGQAGPGGGRENVVQASGNQVAWLEERNSYDRESNVYSYTQTLKFYNGSTTTMIASQGGISYYEKPTMSPHSQSVFALRDSKLAYITNGNLFLYDPASATPSRTQLTSQNSNEEDQTAFSQIDILGDRILWTDPEKLYLTQPSNKPILSFNPPIYSVVEGLTSPQNVTLTVTLSKASTTPVSVRWETFTDWDDPSPADSGGGEGYADYTSSSGVLTFGAGVTSQTLSVPILNDNWDEQADQMFHVRLLDPSNAVLVPGQTDATITISDNWQVSGANGDTFNLPAGVENLTLLGSSNINAIGNSNKNRIVGNSGNNILDGGDPDSNYIDTLTGGLGDDTYIVYRDWHIITEKPNEGTDTVQFTWIVNSSDYTLGNNLENLILMGAKNVSGYGNELNNTITGNSGDNILNGKAGIDTVNYSGSPAAVVVNLQTSSATGWGNDTVSGFENVTGSSFNDTITGDSGNNVLTGGAGADRITGAGGADKFDYRVLTDSLLSSGLDVITDFNANAGGDKLLVSTARAGFLNAGVVSALTNSAIGAKLSTKSFLPHYAASFQVGSGAALRTYIAINNGTAGFNVLTDTIINVTGLSGTIGASHFVTS